MTVETRSGFETWLGREISRVHALCGVVEEDGEIEGNAKVSPLSNRVNSHLLEWEGWHQKKLQEKTQISVILSSKAYRSIPFRRWPRT